MSAPLFKADVLFDQRILACAGFYTDRLDGKWGDHSEAAQEAFDAAYLKLRDKLGALDTRSEKCIQTLLPAFQQKAREIMKAAQAWAKAQGLTVAILSGTRTYAEQNALYKQRPKVTNAAGGQSNHNFGIALDLGLFKGSTYIDGDNAKETQMYCELAVAVKAAVKGVDWGGDWKSFKDHPHYELSTGLTLAQKRRLFEKGALSRG